MEWKLGITEVEHCQHCRPLVKWIENNPGKAPELVFEGFPRDGWMVLSKAKVILLCKACAGSSESIQAEIQRLTQKY